MFEISGNDITALNDGDLRSLVARLALAELKAKGHPLSSVTAGGNQDAADGGIDVRVECPSEIANPDFVPRRLTGFQVKKPDMPASAIRDEMRPEGVLRDSIRALADAAGAYVIVCSQGSVADKPLADRRQAIRDGLSSLSTAAQLHTDFYDRERLATWVAEYPGISAWVRSRVGRPLCGWGGIADWEGVGAAAKPYLSNDKACLIDERSGEREHLPIAEGITRLRAGLRMPKQCIRLIGLSGLGKTRLVQALFENGVGADPLDSSLAVYTDYSETTVPTARDMARELIAQQKRAILVVDNCNPSTHAELAKLCASDTSQVSLITVEYDVRDDEPEHTAVFRLQAASSELVIEWLKQSFPEVSQVDREKIAEFSDGNFRVARALAETLGKGETLGRLKSRELFERIFQQRNQPDRDLLQSAEDLSLLYSIDGEDESAEGELARVGAIRGVGAQPLYAALVEMRNRGVVQARGRFRAILPQAIANPLAAHALERIPPARFDGFCGELTPRMLKSVSRRVGYLHDSKSAQAVVARWLRSDGPLGDLIAKGSDGVQIIVNIAPVAPETVLAKLERELNGPDQNRILAASSSGQWARLIKNIGYDAALFDRALMLLTRFVSGEKDEQNMSPGLNAFAESFHISLSGTQAIPAQRRALIRRLAASGDAKLRSCASIATRALLKSGYFTCMGSGSDFGARPRDWGWRPKINQEVWDWYAEAIALVADLMPETEARALLASSLRGLWRYPGCRTALERTAAVFIQTRPWIEGWIAGRATLRYDGKKLPEASRVQLEKLVERLKPVDLLNRARAVVLNRMPGVSGWDFADGEEENGEAIEPWKKADRMAQEAGRALANDAAIRAEFLKELLLEPEALRAFQCGVGLAEGATDLCALWNELSTAYSAAGPRVRNSTVLGGFISEAHRRDQNFTSHALDRAIDHADLHSNLPYLQSQAGLDAEGLARLGRAISAGRLDAINFRSIANGSVAKSPSAPLAALLEEIATLPNGVGIALEILSMYFFCQDRKGANVQSETLVSVGRSLLVRADFKTLRDHTVQTVIDLCLSGEAGKDAAEKVCAAFRTALDSYHISSHNYLATLNALFGAQPFVALDVFLLPTPTSELGSVIEFEEQLPIEKLKPEALHEWARRDSNMRYPLVGKCLRLFTMTRDEKNNEKEELSALFVSMLAKAPDKSAVWGGLWERVHPRSWSGSLADILITRKAQMMTLVEHPDEQVRGLMTACLTELDRWIEQERGHEQMREESFE